MATKTSKYDGFEEMEQLNESTDNKKRNFCEQCTHAIRNITVEPVTLLYIVASMINSTALQNLGLEKACRVNLQYSDAICDALKSQDIAGQNEYEKETQKLLARALTWKTYLSATIPCMLVMFAGSFSDKTGYRKMFMAIAITGQIFCALSALTNVYFFDLLPLEALIFSDALLQGISGGWCLCFLAVFVYICAITSEKDRTYRMGLVNLNVTVAYPIGMGAAGPILKAIGYYGCYGITIIISFTNLLYVLFVLKDPARSTEQKEHEGRSCAHYMRTFCSIENVKDTLKVVYKKTPDNRRVRMFILLGLVCALYTAVHGESVVMYMLTRYRFNWDEIKYSIFQAYSFIVHTSGIMVSVVLFSKYLQWHDSLLGIISTISKILGSFVYAFAPSGRIFFLAPIVDILNGTALLAVSTIFSKMVAPNELGSVYSVISLSENIMPLICVPLYTTVYTATMDVLPGAVFLLGTVLTIPALCTFSYLFYEHRKQLRTPKAQEATSET